MKKSKCFLLNLNMKSILSKNWRKRYCFSKLRKVKVFHLKIPKATVLDIKTQKVLTKDSVTVSVDAVVYYRCYCNIHRHHHRQHLHHPHHRHHHYHPHILVSMLLSPDQVFSEIGSQLINTMVTHFSELKTWMTSCHPYPLLLDCFIILFCCKNPLKKW